MIFSKTPSPFFFEVQQWCLFFLQGNGPPATSKDKQKVLRPQACHMWPEELNLKIWVLEYNGVPEKQKITVSAHLILSILRLCHGLSGPGRRRYSNDA